jgi:two-component system chemotaxis response regulator CheB
MSRIRVLVVEDSPVVREFLQDVIGCDSRLEVAAVAESAEQALRLLGRVSPDVIALDIRLPGMNGLEATRRIMAERPTPIVLISASVDTQGIDWTMRALEAGALTVIEKPVARTQDDSGRLARQLCTQLAIMSQVKVIRQRARLEARQPAAEPAAERGRFRAVGIAASTGGPGALVEILAGLGKDFGLPVLVVQHLTTGFLRGFGEWLQGACPLAVERVYQQAALSPGTVYLPAGDQHLLADRTSAYTDGRESVSGHRPSATLLFGSMAEALGGEAIGVVLTGMGADGAEGLLELRRAGGYTIAEDESSAVVYGMPAAAVRLGAVRESLPRASIAARIRELACAPRGRS